MRVLITHPDIEDQGGVSNLYKQLQNKFKVHILHFRIGKRPNEKSPLSQIFRMFHDYYKFVKCLKKNDVDIVHLNPSLGLKSFIRDGLFSILARIYKKRIVVFFHGWNKSFERCIDRNYVWLFKFFYGRCNVFFVLARDFKKTLKKWGMAQPIYQGVTVIDEDELEGFNIEEAIKKRQSSKKWRVLFLSRILKKKGIYETVEAVSHLNAKYPMVELIVAGEGEELKRVRSLVDKRNISNIKFVGYIRGEEKRRILQMSHVFCYPTHGEGLPTCVVEAMAYGLPVVTRPVGGLVDFFKNAKHGFITGSLDPIIFSNLIERLFLNKEIYNKMSLHNYKYAQLHFLASKAASRLETVYVELLKDHNCH